MTTIPVMMPKLARGKHRSARRGACFMELASYLAGERWSDHPACTDPFLAHTARMVNDFSTDAARPRLALLVPRVIGMTDLGPGFADEVALMAAIAALPIAAEHSQRAIAVGALQILGEFGMYQTSAREPWPDRARAQLADQPTLAGWARDFGQRYGRGSRRFATAIPVTELAIQSISRACVDNPDERLHEVLAGAIAWAEECARADTTATPELHPDDWTAILQPA